jgi:hypothetical protein
MSKNDTNLIQLGARRKEKQDDLKREYERFLFNKILGCYSVIQKHGMKPIELVDISKSGMSFKVSAAESLFMLNEELDIRLYFSHKNYIDTKVKIIRSTRVASVPTQEWQYGCEFDKSLQSYTALEKFVDFIEAFSANAKEDRGDRPILYF